MVSHAVSLLLALLAVTQKSWDNLLSQNINASQMMCELMGVWTGQAVMSLEGLGLTQMSPKGVLGVPRVICKMIDRGLT